MGNASSDGRYVPVAIPPPGGYLVGDHIPAPQVPYQGYPPPPFPSGPQPPYGASYGGGPQPPYGATYGGGPQPPFGAAYGGGPQPPYGAAYGSGQPPHAAAYGGGQPTSAPIPANAVFAGKQPNKLKALWSKYTDQAPVQYFPEADAQPAAQPAAPPAAEPTSAAPPPLPDQPASPTAPGQLPPVIARDTEHAKELDAADGTKDGKYFGAPIHVAPRKLAGPPASPVKVASPAPPPPVEPVKYGRDKYGYDFPVLEEVVELSDHGRPLHGPVKRAADSADLDREDERDHERGYDRAYDHPRYDDRDWQYGYDREPGYRRDGYSQSHYAGEFDQGYYGPRPAVYDGYDQDLGYYGRRY
eukprot:EG_transcript_13434